MDNKIKLVEDQSPNNLTEAVERLYSELNDADKAFIKTYSSTSVHHGMGRALRNEWHLWNPAGKLSKWFQKELGIGHADDISSTILTAVWARVKDEPFNAWGHVKTYKRHWYATGVDPINQGPMTYERMQDVQKEIGIL